MEQNDTEGIGSGRFEAVDPKGAGYKNESRDNCPHCGKLLPERYKPINFCVACDRPLVTDS